MDNEDVNDPKKLIKNFFESTPLIDGVADHLVAYLESFGYVIVRKALLNHQKKDIQEAFNDSMYTLTSMEEDISMRRKQLSTDFRILLSRASYLLPE